jgi:hypothetical protein
MPPNAWSRRTAVGLLLLAAALPLSARGIAGPRGALVHVRWQPSVTTAGRQALEQRFQLTRGEPLDATTWRYDLADPSSGNISALIAEPAAADTHDINRSAASLDPAAVRTTRQSRFPAGDAIVAAADRLAGALAVFGVLLAFTATLARTPHARAAALRTRRIADVLSASVLGPIVRFVQRGIPQIDAHTAGVFRIVFGAATLAYFVLYPVDSSWLARTFDLEVDGPVHQAIMQWLRGRPAVVDLVGPWLLVTGAAFIAGVFTRVTYALFVAGAVLWAFVAVSLSSTHPQSILVLTLVALLPSRWGDSVSVDAWRHTKAGRAITLPAGCRYGYSVWVPVLAFGVAFAAAAWAKLTVPPGWTSWVVNGTVKYHFITDSVNAPVQWGLQLATHPWLAVLASFLAIAIESLVITAAFIRNEWYRLAMGLGAACLIAGFGLFMGVFWPGWWLPLLGFLPWARISQVRSVRLQAHEPGPAGRLRQGHYVLSRHTITVAQLLMIAAVISQQMVVSSLRLERAPMFSWYDMYSGTYASPAAFTASRPPRFRIVASRDTGNVELGRCNPHEEFVRQFEAAVGGSPEAQADVWEALRGCGDLTGVRAVVLEGDLNIFDWDLLQFTTTQSARVVGPLARPHGDVADR